jgi:hypothetical protein
VVAGGAGDDVLACTVDVEVVVVAGVVAAA